MLHARKLALAPLLAAIWLAPAPATACKCPQRSTTDALKAAQAVLEGRVMALEERDGQLSARLSVVRAWKGVEREEVVVTTPSRLGECGVRLQRDESYLIFAVLADDGETLTTTRCHGTKPMAMAAGDLQELGMGVTPFVPRKPKPAAKDEEPPARGGCASCSIGQRAGRPESPWWLLPAAAAAAWRARRRCR